MKSGEKVAKLVAAVSLAFALPVLAPSMAGAAALSIDDTSPAETITVSACDFEGGAAVNGVPMGPCGVGAGGSVTVPEIAAPVVFDGVWITPGVAGSIDRTIYFLEFGSNAISDIFHYIIISNGTTSTIHAEFFSDTEDANLGFLPTGVDPADVFSEPRSGILTVPFSYAFLTGNVSSDGADVPEPATLGLLGLGLAGLGFSRRKKAA